ncbi:unnamed protein product [Caenorhabditis angaria]|uniref:Uncharacterized protein n=1 Tax=Caenorhabditis angaria TaxID=860376 RepID=A0A9P1N5M2_9PELO|nr:unnamed protein product [Caenorhabditis angaria]
MSTCDVEAVENLSNSKILHIAEGTQLILSLIAFPLLVRGLLYFQTSKKFHFNIRLIAWFHVFSLILHLTGRILQSLADLYMHYGNFPICERRPTNLRCFCTRIIYVFGLFSASYSTVFMVVERTIATKYYAEYENRQYFWGFALVSVQILMGSLTTFSIFNKFNFEQPINFCSASRNSSPWLIVTPEILILIFNFVAFFQFNNLLKINSKLRGNSQNLNLSMGQKYQIEENVNLIRMLRKFTTCDFVFVICYFSMGIPFHVFGKYLDPPIFYAIFESIYIVPIYSIIMPFLIYKYDRKLCDSRIHSISQEIKISNEIYFEQYNKQWSSKSIFFQKITMSNNSFKFNCSEMLEISTSPFLISVLMTNSIFCVLGVICLVYSWKLMGDSKLMHFNLRLLLKLHCAALICHCVPRFFLHLTDLWFYFTASNCYEMEPGSIRCFILRFPYMFGMILSSTTTIFLLIERIFATCKSATYEHGYKYIGISIGCAQILCSLLLMISVFHEYDFGESHYYCSSLSIKQPLWVIVPEIVIMSMQILARIFNRVLLRVNKSIRTKSFSSTLSNRFQIESNLRNIRLVQSFTLCDLLFVFTCFIVSAPIHYNSPNMPRSTYHAWVEVVHFVPIYSIIMPMYLWVYSKKQRDNAVNTLQAALSTSPDHYFEILNDQLNMKTKKDTFFRRARTNK